MYVNGDISGRLINTPNCSKNIETLPTEINLTMQIVDWFQWKIGNFCNGDKFFNLIKSNSYFKSSLRTCIYLILTNRPNSFQDTGITATGTNLKNYSG